MRPTYHGYVEDDAAISYYRSQLDATGKQRGGLPRPVASAGSGFTVSDVELTQGG